MLVAWPFNAAGFSTRWVFEVLGKELWGSEGALPQYMLLMYLQGSMVAVAFAFRYNHCKTFKDWAIISLGVVFFVNSMANLSWYCGVG
jgi:hypothetical protein